MEGFQPDDIQRFGELFPIKLSAVTNSSGTFLYDGNEQIPNSTGSYTNSNPGRTFTNTQNLLMEVNNLQLNTVANTIVWGRLRGVKPDGVHVYEFVQGGGATSSSTVFRGARVTNTGIQSIPDTTLTYIIFNTETFDVSSFHDNATNNTRLTAPTTGYYLVGGTAGFVFNATGVRQFFLQKNRTDTLAIVARDTDTVASNPTISASGVAHFTAGDYAEMALLHTAGAALNTVNTSMQFWMTFLGS